MWSTILTFRRLRRTAAICLTVIFAVCATYVASAHARTLSIHNLNGFPIGVYIDANRIATADAGWTCVKLLLDMRGHVLSFKEIAKRPVTAPTVSYDHSLGWSVTLGHNLRMDVESLQPADPC